MCDTGPRHPDREARARQRKRARWMATIYYLISDLHIGGDGGLAHCEFEDELVAFLADIAAGPQPAELVIVGDAFGFWEDRKSTRLNSSHLGISYAVFCLKK